MDAETVENDGELVRLAVFISVEIAADLRALADQRALKPSRSGSVSNDSASPLAGLADSLSIG